MMTIDCEHKYIYCCLVGARDYWATTSVMVTGTVASSDLIGARTNAYLCGTHVCAHAHRPRHHTHTHVPEKRDAEASIAHAVGTKEKLNVPGLAG